MKFDFAKSLIVLLLFMTGMLTGCGGGTTGSGLAQVKSFDGIVSTQDHTPISNVRVTLTDTGETTITDDSGRFTLNSSAFGDSLVFLIEFSDFATTFEIRDVSEDSQRISLDVTADSESKMVHVTHFSVKASMIGKCKEYFDNDNIIRQVSEVPEGTICNVKVRIRDNGHNRRLVPMVLQHARCEKDAPWIISKFGETGDQDESGIAYIRFKFVSSDEFCTYRILAPFEYRGFTPIAYPIETLQEAR